MPRYINLNNKHEQLVMIHIPKTAGITLRKGLIANQYELAHPVGKYSWKNVIRKLKGIEFPGMHGTANEHKIVLGEKTWENIFSFTFVRNPWDMMVSSYFWWLQIGSKKSKKEHIRQQAEEIRQLGSFSNFINSVYGREMINDQYGNVANWITDENDQIMVKFVGKFENLENDWQSIGKILNFKDTKLSLNNKSQHFSYQSYYNTQTRKVIENRFEWVIEKFKYQF